LLFPNSRNTQLIGLWDEGIALDKHTTSSELTGYDVYGNPKFNNQYTDMGQSLNSFKYRYNHNELEAIISLAKPYISDWIAPKNIDYVLPVPPTIPRVFQPAAEVAREIASMIGAGFSDDILIKVSPTQAKALKDGDKQIIEGTIYKTKKATSEHDMLLVDDIYDTGTTLNECVKVLREDPMIKKIYVLTLTKTRPSQWTL